MKLLMQELLRSVFFGYPVSTLPAGTEESETGLTAEKARVSLIISTLNEANNLYRVLPSLPMDWIDEVILVDGRSADDMVSVAKKLLPEIEIVTEKSRGGGAAVKAGYPAAIAEILVVLDADDFDDPREIPRFLKTLQEEGDIAKGS